MKTANTNRTSTGQFTKGNGGRPKGSKNKRKTYTPTEFSASVAEAARDRLEGLMDKALGVIEQALDSGDVRTAIWVMDRSLPPVQHKLSEAIPEADLSSMEGIISAAQSITQMALEGRLGLEETSRFQTILGNTANLLGYQRLGELSELLDAFEKRDKQRRTVSADMMPMWGRLREQMKQ